MGETQIEAKDFSDCLDQPFLIHVADADPLEMALVEVRELPPPAENWGHRKPFSVLFRGPTDAPLQQGTFRIENKKLGEMDVFLVTIGPAGSDGLHHEAIFA